MADQILSMLGDTITQGIVWFEDMLNASGYASFYIAAFCLFLISKFLLRPIFGIASSAVASGTSDMARKIKNR